LSSDTIEGYGNSSVFFFLWNPWGKQNKVKIVIVELVKGIKSGREMKQLGDCGIK